MTGVGTGRQRLRKHVLSLIVYFFYYSCFNIIATALIGHAYVSLDRLAAIQERTVRVIARMDTSYKPCVAAGM